MIRFLPMCCSWSVPIVLLAMATVARADDLRDWYCPYTTEGACTPKRQTYGYFAPKWRRWPGVTNADYQSKRPPQEPTAPPAESQEQGLPPTELLLPPTNFPRDTAPVPPGGAGEPQPLTPETPLKPDILSPPGEDVMDELLPGLDRPSAPAQRPPAAQRPQSPNRSKPSDSGAIPFPEANEPADNAPAPGGKAPSGPVPVLPGSSSPTPEPSAPSNPPGESDPFKNDPFFNESGSAPSGSRQPARLDRLPEFPSQAVPAMHEAPARLPAAGLDRTPQSRLSRASNAGQPTPARTRRDVSQAGPRVNPLRAAAPVDDRQVLPVAAWQSETDLATPEPVHHNSLR